MPIQHPSFGTLDDDRIIIFDTTLRDGEQSPGFSMNLEEKLRMAEALAELGIDVMEAGFPIASPGDFESVRAIAERFAKDGPVICGLARTSPADILRAAEAVKPAARKRIHTFVSTSPLHMRVKLRMEPEEVLELVTSSVSLARQHTDESLPAIGKRFGGRDHSTVLHACRRASERIASDPEAFAAVRDITAALRGEETEAL